MIAVFKGDMKHCFHKDKSPRPVLNQKVEFMQNGIIKTTIKDYTVVAIKELQINGKKNGKTFSAKVYVDRVQITNENLGRLAKNLGYNNAGEFLNEHMTKVQKTVKGYLYCWVDAHYDHTTPAPVQQCQMDFGGVPQF